MAWRRISAFPEHPVSTFAQQVFCFWLIREPEADRDVYSAQPKRFRGKRPEAAGRPAFSRTEGIGDPFEDAVPAATIQKKEHPSQRLTPKRSAHPPPPQLPSKLGQAPQAPADKFGVKSAFGPHPQNVRDSASGAMSTFWSSRRGPDPFKQHYEEGRGRRPWRLWCKLSYRGTRSATL